MINRSFRYTAFGMSILEKILGSNFSVTGIEKLPKHPILFTANHFTRSETFFIPYLIYKHTGRQVRCLADSGLFFGTLGRFLNSTGAISTRDPMRDNIIVSDLISSNHDWMIYPEGSMIKSKEIRHETLFTNYTPHRVGPVRTGSAVLALKSQLYRSDLIEAHDSGNEELQREIEQQFSLKYQDYLRRLKTYIVPLSITYYPIRPGHNSIQTIVEKLIKKIPAQISEELEIEGNIMLGAEINVNFGDPIDLESYVKNKRAVIKQIPIIGNETKNNLVLRYFKSNLTERFMKEIYGDVQINFDHIFSAALHHFSENEIEINHLKRVIYISALLIKKTAKYRLNNSILEENLYKIFLNEPHLAFDSAFELAKKQGLIKEVFGEKIIINKNNFELKFDFHEIRKENTLQVIANEFFLLDGANSIVKRVTKTDDCELRQKVFAEIHKHDLENFAADYAKYFDVNFSKEKSVGTPFFLDSNIKAPSKIKKVGIIVAHGYKAAPQEVEPLAKYLNGFGFKVYAARMHGHGTAPKNLADSDFEKWYDGVQRGYAALANITTKIVIIGFSTGGLLALLSAIRKKNKNPKKLCAIVAINAALKLVDIRSRMIPGINLWNEILTKFHIESGKFEYVDDQPEKPQINYSRNYIKGVHELEKLMEICDENLAQVEDDCLVIQGSKDSVVNPESGEIIYKKISSKQKYLAKIDFSNHVIVNCDRQNEVFEEISEFLVKIKIM